MNTDYGTDNTFRLYKLILQQQGNIFDKRN